MKNTTEKGDLFEDKCFKIIETALNYAAPQKPYNFFGRFKIQLLILN